MYYEEFRGVRLTIRYVITNAAGEAIILKKQFPEFDQVLRTLSAEQQNA